jgi:putative ABC transport system substrate-binding protein
MRRREFIGIVGGATVRLLIAGGASAAAASRVVMLSIASDPSARLGAFRKQMNELGYVEGRNITIEFRSAEGQIERLPALAETLVREEKADVILAESTAAAVAAHQATQTIPIVALVGVDPVASGLAVTLARPGGNVTGVAIFADEASPKRVELVRELAPHAVRLAVAMATFERGGKLNLTPVEETASKLALQLLLWEMSESMGNHDSEVVDASSVD